MAINMSITSYSRNTSTYILRFDFLQEHDGVEHPKKRIKREIIVGPGIDKDVSHEAVGLKPATLVPKEIPIIKKKNPVLQVHFSASLNTKMINYPIPGFVQVSSCFLWLQIKIAPKKVQHEVNDDTQVKEPEKLDSSDAASYATIEQIESQKLPPEEILSLPMFKVIALVFRLRTCIHFQCKDYWYSHSLL